MKLVKAIFVTLLSLAAGQSRAGLPWETWTDLHSLANVGGNYGTYLASSYCLDGCRYDRTSVDPGRGGQRFIRVEHTAEGDQDVILDQPGAGAVTRIWMTTGDGKSTDLPSDVRLRVFFDDADVPAIDKPLNQFFHDTSLRFASRTIAPPLESDRLINSGGNVSYLPLPYQHGIKIALLNGADARLWYQINYTQVPDSTPVESFKYESVFAPLSWLLQSPVSTDSMYGRLLPFGRDLRSFDLFRGMDSNVLHAGDSLALLDAPAAGWITSTQIAVDHTRWDDLVISFAFDGVTTVDLPIAEFFATDSIDKYRSHGVLAGVDGRGAFYASMPMPFHAGAKVVVRFRDGAQNTSAVVIRSKFETEKKAPPATAGTFWTAEHAACPTTPAVTGDEILLAHNGAGRMIGLAAWMSGDGTLKGGYYMEGDERVYIDGSVQPLWYGTGVEDAYNGGFYFDNGPYIGPLAGAPFRNATSDTTDATSMYRWFLTDSPTWRKSIVYKLENGATGTDPMCLRTVAYYYALPDAAQDQLATLQIGDTGSEAAAGYAHGDDAQCDVRTAQFGDEPPTSATAAVCTGTSPSRFEFKPGNAGTAFRLRRTYDAGLDGQAAEIWVNGAKVGAWTDVQANPTRRWSQMDVDFALPLATDDLVFEIRPVAGGRVTESRYELWGDVAPTEQAGPAAMRPIPSALRQ